MSSPPLSHPPKDHDESGAIKILGNQEDHGVATQSFLICKKFTTFFAEYTGRGKDIVVHFFPSREAHLSPNARHYWYTTFPTVLDGTSRKYFGVSAPRLTAELITGVIPSEAGPVEGSTDSWYFCAQGFADRLDPVGFISRFFSELDAALDATKVM